MLRQPLWKPLLFHDVDFGAILVTQLSRVVGIAQQAGIIRHYEGRQEIQQLLFRQVIVIAYPSVGKGLVIDLSEADNAVPVVRKRVLLCILLKSKVERVQQEFSALPLPARRLQTGKRYLQNPVRTGNGNAVHHAGGPEIIAFTDGGAGINQMPQTAGDPLRP